MCTVEDWEELDRQTGGLATEGRTNLIALSEEIYANRQNEKSNPIDYKIPPSIQSLTTERLQLFIKVCQAAQHAHQKAVIHRELKPSNILVTLHDGQPVPKVIDLLERAKWDTTPKADGAK